MTGLILVVLAFGQVPQESVSLDEAVQLVLKHEESRWSQIKSFRATIEQTVENSDDGLKVIRNEIARSKKLAQDRPIAHGIEVILPPRFQTTSLGILAEGDTARFDGRLFLPPEFGYQVIKSPHHVTIYRPAANQVTIQLPSDPVGSCFHPRNFAFLDDRATLLALFTKCHAEAAKHISRGFRQLLKVTLTTDDGAKRVAIFDPSQNYALHRLWNLQSDGETVTYAAFLEYKEFELREGRKVAFPVSSEQFIYGAKGIRMGDSPPPGWNQRFRYEVKNLELDVDVPDDAFELKVAGGTRVVNKITGERTEIPSVP